MTFGVARSMHPVFDSINPLSDDYIPVNHKWTDACLEILDECGLWECTSPDMPNGTFLNKVLDPKRHMGSFSPGARDSMSPVVPKFFASTRSMQNAQVVMDTNSVSRYVVKVSFIVSVFVALNFQML